MSNDLENEKPVLKFASIYARCNSCIINSIDAFLSQVGIVKGQTCNVFPQM